MFIRRRTFGTGAVTWVLFVCFLPPGAIQAQGFLKTSGERIVNEKGENVLLRGVGLGGWMLQEGYMLKIYNQGQQNSIKARMEDLRCAANCGVLRCLAGKPHTQGRYRFYARMGFNSVRLPMHYNLYTLPVEKEPIAGKNTWLEKGFRLTDSLLAWCKANIMYLILDLHAAPGGQGNDLNISDGDTSLPALWESQANQQKLLPSGKRSPKGTPTNPGLAPTTLLMNPTGALKIRSSIRTD